MKYLIRSFIKLLFIKKQKTKKIAVLLLFEIFYRTCVVVKENYYKLKEPKEKGLFITE